ncbi:IclR family transcriptional regulator [Wansuia hejianensis]|uniref:Glycerol operon regulatory protein n=1 Tax=Wansuia hejianensis TaxID=2763667 RepID=A0A7G9GAA1_9FIRM|nr:IclR family transcriptional regulator [Wansuia hejianensis]QNM07733.1 IclR family transcriptional regulator [Wansuia hejianensis]RHV91348.1 IclR family transcriptional regulator [Lachnospiraceae bacterium OF09-33XD]
MENEIKVKSLHKALEILNCFVGKDSLGVTEISERFGLCKSNVHNILYTFRQMGYLEQNEATGKYRLGMQIFVLCKGLSDSFPIARIALPYMQELSDRAGERVYLGIPCGWEVFYLDSTYPYQSPNLIRRVLGMKTPMHCTGLGKAILSNMPEEQRNQFLETQKLTAFTDATITGKEELRRELKSTRLRGYAIDHMEHEFGIKCIALPIFDKDRNIYASMSVSGLASHFTEEKMREWAAWGREYVEKIENYL